MTYGQYPEGIQYIIKQRVESDSRFPGKTYNVLIDYIMGNAKEGFSWDHTIEGYKFWVEVLEHKNYNLFYEKYPELIGKIIIDPEDEWIIEKYGWYLSGSKKKYLMACFDGKHYLLHRFMMGVTEPKVMVDHRNQNTFDFRRENLRICTNSENLCNRGKQKNNTTGYKGVYKTKNSFKNPYYSRITHNKKDEFLGYFPTAEAAALRWNEAAIKYHGEFACLNQLY